MGCAGSTLWGNINPTGKVVGVPATEPVTKSDNQYIPKNQLISNAKKSRVSKTSLFWLRATQTIVAVEANKPAGAHRPG